MLSSLVRPLWRPAARHLYKLIADAGYREHQLLLARLGGRPRFEPCSAKVSGWALSLPDAASFLSAYQEIFVEQIYAFAAASPAPRILDLGANIGLSVLYFKRLYPRAAITAYEADPSVFRYLERNVHGNGFGDVRLVNKAVWDESTVIRFAAEGADGGRVAHDGDADPIFVAAIDIREILRGADYDFLKMDIEGAEERVLPAARGSLAGFKQVFVEYHSPAGRRQRLDLIIGELAHAGFRVHIHSVTPSPSPFARVRVNAGFDMQLNIFAWRE